MLDLEMLPIDDLAITEVTEAVLTSENFAQDYAYLVNMIAKLDEVKKSVDAQIKSVMRDHYLETGESSVTSGDIRYTYVPGSTRETFDAKAFKAADPDLYNKYVKVSAVAESLKAVKINKDK